MLQEYVKKLGSKFVGGKSAWEAFAEEADPQKKRRALDRIVKDNEAYIARCVQALLDRGLVSPFSSIMSLSYDDLLQAGRRGYVRALERFDPSKGALPPFARTWIRKEVRRTAATDATIHRPEQVNIPVAAMRREESIRAQHGRQATAEEMCITDKQLHDWKNLPTVVSMQGGQWEPKAADKDVAPAVDYTDQVKYLGLDPEEEAIHSQLKDLRDNLPPGEREVIRLLFWCDRTPEQVAVELKLTVTTVCEIRDSALSALREDLS